ncbi:diguanylate cyclase/phosphodiesterase with PAS/PAC sensor(s) [Acidovorax sp. 69]|uniref:EAL domain-containing protein n=1 Tax=Acidovorax sp. 69 TaxID=2035202 RepID=UPI000CB18187|nr:EAL domain-containing protein [Acidovorax sp. 69]PJI97702.1 diguanylate cyclase/phosphodiesterase with PAS/PAC sensor(s) [Acidovorax sp. 69]
MDVLQTVERRPVSLTLRVTWPFITMVLLLVACASASLYVLSTVRAFVAGESLWTKGQKDAIYFLDQYATTGSPQAFAGFTRAMEIPLGDHAARLALQPGQVQTDVARDGFLRGGNHPDDIDGLIWLLRYFDRFDLVKKPVDQWLVGDEYINALRELSHEIHQHNTAGTADAQARERWQTTIREINAGVTPAARNFSDALGESSRHIVLLLMWTNMGMAVILIMLTLWHTHGLLAQRRRAELNLEAEREQARTTLTAIGDAVVTTNMHGEILYMNPAAEALLARSATQAAGLPLAQLLVFDGEAPPLSANALVQTILHSGSATTGNIHRTLVRADQTIVPVKLVGSPIRHQGALTGAVLVLHDVTREQHYVEQLSWQASHDALTGLVNRREFEHRLEALLAQPRPVGREGSLLYVDMDQFKLINDTCGHQAGDEMLREVCRMLQSHLREGDTLARLGGDEFGILLKDCPAGPSARIAEQLRQAGQELRLNWGDQQLRTGLSIGMVQLIPALTSIQEAMRVADMACYRAKESGRNRVFIYQTEDIEMSRREGDMDWVRRLRLALEHNQFQLYAQAIAPLQPEGETGLHMEVLLRLPEDDGQLIAPGCFIPAAEHYGMMPSIDRWVIRHTLEALAQRQNLPGVNTPVHSCAINLSGTSLGDDSLLKLIRSALTESGVDPRVLCFEITETSAISHLPNAVRLMKELQQLGCRFALDDFGAGMSSFNYLKHLPVDYLKIDGSFVKDMLQDAGNRAMVEMIHHIGQVTGKQTIAEFAESQAIVDALRGIGVNYAQGYALARPIPLDDYLAMQRTPQPGPPGSADSVQAPPRAGQRGAGPETGDGPP